MNGIFMRKASTIGARALMTALLAAAIAVSVALIAPGCGTSPAIKLRIGAYPSEMTAPVAVAGEKGFFISNGLDVTVTTYETGAAAVKALLAGEVDAATAADYVFATSSFTAPDLRLLASIDRVRTMWFVSTRESGISKTADLKGRSVGLPAETMAEYAMGSSLDREGLSVQDVKVVNLTPKDMSEALQSGSVDAVAIWDPVAYQLKESLGKEAVSWSALGGNHFDFTVISTERVLKEKPGMSERLMRSMLEAVDFIKERPAEAKRIVSKAYGLGMQYLDYTWPNNYFEVSLTQGLMFHLDMEARWFVESGLAGASAPPDYLKLIDFTGLERADPDAVEVIH